MAERSFKRGRGLVVGAPLAVALVGLAWVAFESFTVQRSAVNPTVDSREALRKLAEQTAGISRDEGEAAWSRFANLTMVLNPAVPDDWAAFAAGPPGIAPPDRSGMLLPDERQGIRWAAQIGKMVEFGGFPGAAGQDLVTSFATKLQVARTIAYQGPSDAYIDGARLELRTLEKLSERLRLTFPDKETCRGLLDALDRLAFPPPALAVEAEKIIHADFVQWSYGDDGDGRGYLVESHFDQFGRARRAHVGLLGAMTSRFFCPSRTRVEHVHAAATDRLLEILELPRPEQAGAIAEWEATMARTAGVGHLAALARLDMARRTRRDGMRILIALDLHLLDHGDYPETLDPLVPAYLDELPLDDQGRRFAYRRDRERSGRQQYWLHSIGPDGIDQGGAPNLAGVDWFDPGGACRSGDVLINP